MRQHPRRGGVEQARKLGLALGLVYGRVGGGVDDHVGAQGAHGVGDTRRIGKVTAVFGAVEVERGEIAQHGETALQLPADLAALAQKQDVHAAPC